MTSDSDVTDAQIAGLLLAVAALMGEIRRKGVLDGGEIDGALQRMATDIGGSKLAQATPDDPMVEATLAPIEQLRRMNALWDEDSGGFSGWIAAAGGD